MNFGKHKMAKEKEYQNKSFNKRKTIVVSLIDFLLIKFVTKNKEKWFS